jgi:hypothetical protein
MAVLSDPERFACWKQLMRDLRDIAEDVTIQKADLRAAVDAIDDFLNDNATTINQAIPQPARSALSTKQKALLLMAVIVRRYLNT